MFVVKLRIEKIALRQTDRHHPNRLLAKIRNDCRHITDSQPTLGSIDGIGRNLYYGTAVSLKIAFKMARDFQDYVSLPYSYHLQSLAVIGNHCR
ncbi:unknown [Prevotella sp. CAG:617]|nr:unknown [Prevotella sp. CAG:617]